MAARTRQLAQMAQQLMQLAGERDVAVGAGPACMGAALAAVWWRGKLLQGRHAPCHGMAHIMVHVPSALVLLRVCSSLPMLAAALHPSALLLTLDPRWCS